jgi:hypothetical protein
MGRTRPAYCGQHWALGIGHSGRYSPVKRALLEEEAQQEGRCRLPVNLRRGCIRHVGTAGWGI